MDSPLGRSGLRRSSTSRPGSQSLPPTSSLTDTPSDTFVLEPTTTSHEQHKDNYMLPGHLSETQTWTEDDELVSSRTTRLQIELAECVETKTVTTTTTTKRSYPPLLVRPPRSLHKLDAKEYPLASKPTPLDLTSFSYKVDGELVHFREDDPSSISPQQIRQPPIFSEPTNSDKRPSRRIKVRGYGTPETLKSARTPQTVEDVTAESFLRRSSRSIKPSDLPEKATSAVQRRNNSQAQRTDTGPSHSRRPSLEAFDRVRAFNKHSLVTPDLSASSPHSLSLMTSASEPARQLRVEPRNLLDAGDHGVFPTAVATPPITETDLEPFGNLAELLRRPSLSIPPTGTTLTSNASLPSPSLSPTLAAANLHNAQFPVVEMENSQSSTLSSATQSSDSQESYLESSALLRSRSILNPTSRHTGLLQKPGATVMDTRSMLDTFDSMPSEMKTFMMYQFLRRCPRKTLQTVADVVNPVLKCDFLGELPAELSLQILSFLDHKDFCRVAQVSKRWRSIVDSNETGWKELLDRDNLILPEGELERAIVEGWGWQDPVGIDGYECDLSTRPGSSDGEIVISSNTRSAGAILDSTQRLSTKRKRTPGSIGPDWTKRRIGPAERRERGRGKEIPSDFSTTIHNKRLEGANASATAAALAVPDPQLGLPSLRKLHLFKSLYRRHYMLERNWMGGAVKPRHMAFPAHPRHVITCLQFDDDKILTGSDDTYIHVYDTRTGALRRRLEGHEGGVWALQYEGNTLVSGSTDRSVRVWDIERGVCTQVFHGHTSTVRCLQILMPMKAGETANGKLIMIPEKPLIITGSRDSQLRVWKLPEHGSKRYGLNGQPAQDVDCPFFIRVLQGHTHSVRAIAAHQDTLVSGSYDSTVRVWKISTGETLHNLRGHTLKVYSVVLDNPRHRCISGSMDNFVKIWSLDTGACLYNLEGHSSLVGLLDLQDNRLVSAAADSTLRIWDPANGQCKNTLTAHTGAITCFQHDNSKVISGSDRTLKMWNVKTGECLQDLLTDLSGVWQVKFDQRRCVAAVQRENLTFIEVLDFGASRDGVSALERGQRVLLPPSDADRITDDDEFVT